MRALSVVLAAVAVVCLIVAIAGMVTGRPGARTGLIIRVVAVACFAGAVALNLAAR